MTTQTVLLVVINFLFLRTGWSSTSFFSGQVFTGCPSGWVRNSGQCYMFSTEEKFWPEADDFCRNINSGVSIS